MYKGINDEVEVIEGFYYNNHSGFREYVKMDNDSGIVVTITCDLDTTGVDIYKEDIPKLIKALQMAHTHMKGN